jgi:ATP-dependent Zn protease
MGRRPTERETNCGLLNGHRQVLDRLVQLLLTKETIDGSEVYALAGRPEPPGREPGDPRP